jgi:hypothetical protein
MKLSTLDYAFTLMDGAAPQDFTLIFHLSESPSLDNLRAGALSATHRFPTSGCHIRKRHWVYAGGARTGELSARDLSRFANESFDLRGETLVKQMLITGETREACLVTKFHHAAADGLSAAMWLAEQLSVAYGLKDPIAVRSSFADFSLRQVANSARRSIFAYRGACEPLWTTNYIPSGARRWLTINFPATDLRHVCRRARGFTYSDLLATCALEVFKQWNQKHTPKIDPKIGLWLPVNIRRQFSTGFGNGTSRIRLYARYPQTTSIVEKAREVRKQLFWSIETGEWVIPHLPAFTRLPRRIAAPLLNGYLKQPSVDMATGIFSHAERWAGDAAEAFKHVSRIECVGLLHPRQHLAVNGTTHNGQTWLTFTYDPALLDLEHARELTQLYERQIELAKKEVLCERSSTIACARQSVTAS